MIPPKHKYINLLADYSHRYYRVRMYLIALQDQPVSRADMLELGEFTYRREFGLADRN